MISVITPTHKPTFLQETYESLKAQTLQDFEWMLCPTQDALLQISDEIKNDPRVVIHPMPSELKNIGAIKQKAFMHGTKPYLVELDHDDLLATTALEKIVTAFEKTDADFVYSDTWDFFPNGNSHYYPDYASNGWRYETVEVDGKPRNRCISFKPSANSMSLIYYAPNHVRAWKRDFYHKIGGHNPAFELCDDHELVIRTYLHGTMHHIPEVLYFYRIAENTWSGRVKDIQALTWKLHDQYLEKLILREGELTGFPCIDIGGAFNCPPGWISCDREEPALIKADLTKRWPFEDNSVLAFRAYDFLEHLPDKMHTMSEIHRCLKPGGWLLSRTPSALGQGGFCDPTHVSYWVRMSFEYYTTPEKAAFIRNTDKFFIARNLWEGFPNDWARENNVPYVTANLIALKGDCSEVPGYSRFRRMK